jgi:hypothetical protein
MEDFETRVLSCDRDETSAKVAWRKYHGLPAFVGVVFSQFQPRQKDHRKQVTARINQSERDTKASSTNFTV